MATIRADFISGQVQENPLSSVATTLTMSGRLQDLPTVGGGNVAFLTIDPEGVDVLAGSGTEVVEVTAYTHAAGTSTIDRGKRGTTPRPHSQGVKITLSWMKEDADELVAATGAETTRAEAAETTLQNNINAEATTRGNADTSEASTRASADTTLQNNINAEASTRGTADTNEASTRASADTTLQNNINSEASTRASADTSEASTRASADTSEASTRATEDHKRPRMIGVSSIVLAGSVPALTDEFLEQAGTDILVSDGAAGIWELDFPTAFPNGLLTIIVLNGDRGAAQVIPQLGLTYALDHVRGLLTDLGGTLQLNTTFRINWRAVGW